MHNTFHRQLEFSTRLRFPSSSTQPTDTSPVKNGKSICTRRTQESPQPVQISNGTHMKESSRRSSSTSRMEEFMLRRHVRKSVHFQSTDGVLVLLQVASEALCDSEVWGNIRKSAALHALPISPLFSLQHRESIHKLAGSTRTIQRQLCKGD